MIMQAMQQPLWVAHYATGLPSVRVFVQCTGMAWHGIAYLSVALKRTSTHPSTCWLPEHRSREQTHKRGGRISLPDKVVYSNLYPHNVSFRSPTCQIQQWQLPRCTVHLHKHGHSNKWAV